MEITYTGRQRIGIDVGGTFTDFVILDDVGMTVYKVPTTPRDQSQAILQGLEQLPVDVHSPVMHGTTIATNALLERRGAKTALITTRGFADVLAIGRQDRPELYTFAQPARHPLVSQDLRLEADERIDCQGHIQKELDMAEVRELLRVLRDNHVESVAVVLLFSFLNGVHEQKIADMLKQELPGVPFSLSLDILPEYREYERTVTTVVNAYVRPLVMRYLIRLGNVLTGRSLHIMQSSGGTMDAEQASSQAARLVLSGPAGGIAGSFALAKQALHTSVPQIMTFDMGGTSTDVALCPGRIPQTNEGDIGGFPIRLPATQIHTVGAGGGSLARVDVGGVLRVGPQSAGALPGPVCYGQGGKVPTVTDANLVLGRLIPSQFLGGTGSKALDEESAYAAIGRLGDRLHLSVEETALGIVRVANATMERALQRVSIECGYDPRSYVLLPYGGAGPLHACAIAQALGIRKILVPRYPGVLSAFGLLMADLTGDASHALLAPLRILAASPERVGSVIDQLKSKVLGRLGTKLQDVRLHGSLDLRYAGQSYELTVPMDLPVTVKSVEEAGRAFHTAHHTRYGYSAPELPVESVAVRLQAAIPQGQNTPPPRESVEYSFSISDAPLTSVYFSADRPRDIPLVHRDHLTDGCMFAGPALIVQYDSTVVIPAGWHTQVDRWRNLHLQYGTENEC